MRVSVSVKIGLQNGRVLITTNGGLLFYIPSKFRTNITSFVIYHGVTSVYPSHTLNSKCESKNHCLDAFNLLWKKYL